MARNILTSTRSAGEGNLHHYFLPKGLVQFTIIGGAAGYKLEAIEPIMKLVPDPNHKYFFRYQPNPYTRDDITLEFSPEGFLTHVYTSIEDQTAEFVKSVAAIGTSIAQLTVPLPKTRSLETKVLFTGEIDPFDSDAMTRLNDSIKSISKNDTLELNIEALGDDLVSKPVVPSSDKKFGIFCKPMGTFNLQLSWEGGMSVLPLRLPHPEILHFIEIPRANWVKSEFEIKFGVGGMPTSIRIGKPSSALAFIKLPLDILSAIISLPTQLFQFRLNMNTAKQNALISEDNMRSQLQAFEEKYKELQVAAASRNTEFQPAPESSAAGAGTTSSQAGTSSVNTRESAELVNEIKKLRQDVDLMRKRMNKKDAQS